MTRAHRYGAGFANLALAGLFLWCWLQPHAWKRTLAADLSMLVVLEVIALYITNNLINEFHLEKERDEAARRREDLKRAAGLPVAAIAVLGIVAYAGVWLSAALLLWTVAPRYWLITGLKGEPEATIKEQMATWQLAFLGLVLLVFICKGLPMPRFGMTLPGIEYGIASTWGPPQDLIALGLGYFTLTGLMMLLSRPSSAKPANR